MRPEVTGHRGSSSTAPENTIAALRQAVADGADWVEVDARETVDGEIVLAHDETLARTAGDPHRVAELSIDELRTLDVGRWFGPRFAGERVPTLVEAARAIPVRMNIECKSASPERLAEAIERAGLLDRSVVTSFDLDAVREVKRLLPGVPVGWIRGEDADEVFASGMDLVSVAAPLATTELIGRAHQMGLPVHVFTVNEADQMGNLLRRGVDNLITDRPGLAVRVRGRT